MHVGKEQSDRLLSQVEEPQVEEAPAGGRLRRKAKVGFASAVLLTGLLGLLSWRVAQQAAEDAQWVDHTHQVLIRLEATLGHLVDVETGGRGFAMTGHQAFLEPYESGRLAVGHDLDAVRRLVADNREQTLQLDKLSEQGNAKIEESRNLVTLRQSTGRVPGEGELERGKQIMDKARVTVEEMEAAERRLLEQRTGQARAARQFMVSVITLGSVLGVVFLSIAGITVGREIGISAQAQAQVSALNADLERRVAQRTAALGESEGRLAGVIQSAMDAILTVDEQQNILMFNAAAERMFRCPAAEALGGPITRFIPQRFHAAHGGHIRKFGDTGVTNRTMGPKNVLWAVRADGQEFQIEASISQVVTGGKKLFTVILRDVTERVQAEEAREHLAAVVESTDDAIISKDLNGTINGWNHGAENIFGYRAAEMMGKPILMLFPPERVNEESDILARIRRGESVKHFETVRVRKDGRSIDVSVTISPIKDGSGAIVGASKIARDITERRRAEEALHESQEQFHAMANGIPQLAWMADADGNIFWYNQRWYEYTGTTFEQMEGWGWQTVHDPEMLPKVLEGWKGAIATGAPFEMEFPLRGADGSFRMFLTRVMPVKDLEGRVVRWFGTNTDISERKQAQELLAQQAEELSRQAAELARSREAMEQQSRMLKLVLDSMGEGLVAADAQGHFLIWNDAAKKLMGRGATDLPLDQWTPHYQVYLPDGVTPHPPGSLPLARALRGESVQQELMIQHPEIKEGVFLEVTARPLKDDQGKLCGGVAAMRDITQRKAAEREIQKLNQDLEARVVERTAQLEAANKDLEAFTYSVSHDLRAPLRHISGFSRILVEEFAPSLPKQVQHHLGRIEEGAARMGKLVDELLNLARVGRQALTVQATRLGALVQDVVTLLEPETEGRQVEWKIADLPVVECDPTLLRQVFQNLISNALKYSRPRSPAVIEIGQKERDGQMVIFVKDNGVGFSMKYADKLFGVFQRLHRPEEFEGTGVGLATVQRIVQKHGGRVWAEAEIDCGATFYFTLGGLEHSALTNAAATAGG